jgi:hypothetical protein
VTVKADDGTYMDTHDVTVTVINVDESGTVTLSSSSPSVGVEIAASLDDPDGRVTGEAWQWAKETSDGVYEDIPGATSKAYTPGEGDAGYHMRVTVTYTDAHGPEKEASDRSANAVTAGDPLVTKYDTDEDGSISKKELGKAILDHLQQKTLSKTDLGKLILKHLETLRG